ncbi:TPA: hypothetical protein ACX131_003872 [Citrobacter freundii]
MADKKVNFSVSIKELTPRVLPVILEPELRELYQLACKNSEPLWHKLKLNEDKKPEKKLVDEFISLTHKGMRDAQERIVGSVLSDDVDDYITKARKFAYIGIADAIAWQLLRSELAYAKRFFMCQKPPSLRESNIDSVLIAVEQCHNTEPDSIALISDLTSFIQVGDIYHVTKDLRVNVCEVKSGSVNLQIMKLLENTPNLKEPQDVPLLCPDETVPFQKQVQRVIKQKRRMQELQKTLINDEGVDASTGKSVKIHEPEYSIGTWYESLEKLREDCEGRGFALDVIQDCLYVGCYKSGAFEVPGQLAFEAWFSEMGGTQDCPRTSLVNCMSEPLGLPIYNLPISDELKFDLLFGRKHVSLAIHMPNLIKICEDIGIPIKLASPKETARIKQRHKHIWVFNGQAIILGEGESYLGEGFSLRVFYHGEKPLETLIAFAQKF